LPPPLPKNIGYPIRFISFDGKTDGRVKCIRLIDYEPTTTTKEKLLTSLDKAVKKGNYGWKTLRVTEEGRVEEE